MWMRVLGGVIVVLAGVSAYLTLTKRSSPVPEVPTPPAAVVVEAQASPAPPAPLVLPNVVDVTDIDPLLDPPAIPTAESPAPLGPMLTAVGYEEPKPLPPAKDVVPIPPAARD
jgi:hypothetical protein